MEFIANNFPTILLIAYGFYFYKQFFTFKHSDNIVDRYVELQRIRKVK